MNDRTVETEKVRQTKEGMGTVNVARVEKRGLSWGLSISCGQAGIEMQGQDRSLGEAELKDGDHTLEAEVRQNWVRDRKITVSQYDKDYPKP